MSTYQPRAFNAATNILAYAQAFTSASVHSDGEAVRPRRSRWTRSILRHRGRR